MPGKRRSIFRPVNAGELKPNVEENQGNDQNGQQHVQEDKRNDHEEPEHVKEAQVQQPDPQVHKSLRLFLYAGWQSVVNGNPVYYESLKPPVLPSEPPNEPPKDSPRKPKKGGRKTRLAKRPQEERKTDHQEESSHDSAGKNDSLKPGDKLLEIRNAEQQTGKLNGIVPSNPDTTDEINKEIEEGDNQEDRSQPESKNNENDDFGREDSDSVNPQGDESGDHVKETASKGRPVVKAGKKKKTKQHKEPTKPEKRGKAYKVSKSGKNVHVATEGTNSSNSRTDEERGHSQEDQPNVEHVQEEIHEPEIDGQNEVNEEIEINDPEELNDDETEDSSETYEATNSRRVDFVIYKLDEHGNIDHSATRYLDNTEFDQSKYPKPMQMNTFSEDVLHAYKELVNNRKMEEQENNPEDEEENSEKAEEGKSEIKKFNKEEFGTGMKVMKDSTGQWQLYSIDPNLIQDIWEFYSPHYPPQLQPGRYESYGFLPTAVTLSNLKCHPLLEEEKTKK